MKLESLKREIRSRLPWTADLRKKLSSRKWPHKSIVFYLGKRNMTQESDIYTKGASGSDIAVVFLTQEWVKQGYQVTVFSNCLGQEGVYNGVKHVHYERLNWYDQFDILIIWRHPGILPSWVRARQIWLEWQDVAYPAQDFEPHILNRYTRIFAKSQYQRNLLPNIEEHKFAIIPNGIYPSILDLQSTSRNPYKLNYSSRYYRGLEHMLMYGWPIIKQEVPEAELHIYYGWTKRDYAPSHTEWRQRMMALMEQPGITDHGMVGQEQLIQEKANSAIHYYGCSYKEIDCISVRESAAVGCVPVTTDYAVLCEKDYCVKVSGDPQSRETQEALAYKVVELLKEQDKLEHLRQHFRQVAGSETWDKIALRWLEYA